MITNFMYPHHSKNNFALIIAKKPKYIDNYELFRFCVVFGCFLSLIQYDLTLLSGITLITSIVIAISMSLKALKVYFIRTHIDCLAKLKQIYDTPVMCEDGHITTFTFLSASDKLVDKIMKLNKIVGKE